MANVMPLPKISKRVAFGMLCLSSCTQHQSIEGVKDGVTQLLESIRRMVRSRDIKDEL